jgi:hypothetical protein
MEWAKRYSTLVRTVLTEPVDFTREQAHEFKIEVFERSQDEGDRYVVNVSHKELILAKIAYPASDEIKTNEEAIWVENYQFEWTKFHDNDVDVLINKVLDALAKRHGWN